MEHKKIHRWDLSPGEAIRQQYALRSGLKNKSLRIDRIRSVAGVDVSVKGGLSRAAIVVLSFPSLEVLESVSHTGKTGFPYVPGLLTFREAPVILKCAEKLASAPDVLVFDGQGQAHPRRMGLAAHLGLFLETPSIGSAKSLLYGTFRPPGRKKGDLSLLKDKDGTPLGAALTTRDDTNPVFVSPGHLADIHSSVDLILACCPKYKLPEPIRRAHKYASL
ncbi:MAG: endonuclease V [Candidatus Omnitrophica bacterium]|nr:endonuclease V [Candidatus Omnitrophota bacterium]